MSVSFESFLKKIHSGNFGLSTIDEDLVSQVIKSLESTKSKIDKSILGFVDDNCRIDFKPEWQTNLRWFGAYPRIYKDGAQIGGSADNEWYDHPAVDLITEFMNSQFVHRFTYWDIIENRANPALTLSGADILDCFSQDVLDYFKDHNIELYANGEKFDRDSVIDFDIGADT
jgi:hypothetical protein